MNVASLELCKTLFELSGWNEYGQAETDVHANVISYNYTLGYLLRKLPKQTNVASREEYWTASCGNKEIIIESQRADTPEDAACKLAIELIRKGIIK